MKTKKIPERSFPTIILASTSTYRRELLSKLHLPFSCKSPGVDEALALKNLQTKLNKKLDPKETATALARIKCQAVVTQSPSTDQLIVIGCDQTAELMGRTLGKPHTVSSAIQQLEKMSGKTHYLHSAVTIFHQGKYQTFCDSTALKMRKLTKQEIVKYVEIEQPLDCAGSYKIEGLGISLFQSIQCSDFNSIIGLPLLQLGQKLRKMGLSIP